MEEIRLSDHVQDMIRRYEAGRIEQEEHHRREYAAARQRKRQDMLAALAQSVRSICTFKLRKLIEGFEDFRDAEQAPLPRKVTTFARGDKELQNISGLKGEEQVRQKLQRLCRNPCTALYGYNGAKGEIDIIVVGRYGITAIEVKNYAGTICCEGDSWWRVRSGQREEICDRTGRSPSLQLNQCADELQVVLMNHGFRVAIRRIVVLAHRYAAFGHPFSPAVEFVLPLGYLAREHLFGFVTQDPLNRDGIAQVCDVITHAHERQAVSHASGRKADGNSPLYEDAYRNTAGSSSRFLGFRPWKLAVGVVLLLALGRLFSLSEGSHLVQQLQMAMQRQASHSTSQIHSHSAVSSIAKTRRKHVAVFRHRVEATSRSIASSHTDPSSRLLAQVSRTLAHEQAFRGMRIIPTDSKGVVTLSGTVSNYAAKVLASNEIGKIKGVRMVLNNLKVEPSNTRLNTRL